MVRSGEPFDEAAFPGGNQLRSPVPSKRRDGGSDGGWTGLRLTCKSPASLGAWVGFAVVPADVAKAGGEANEPSSVIRE